MLCSNFEIETRRLLLRELVPGDAPFMLALLNERSVVRYIGDRGVRTLEAARKHVEDGPMASYKKYGFGLYQVVLKEKDTPVGTCGLLQRDTMEHPDLGYAMLPDHRSKGYATEAAAAVVEHARNVLGLERIIALTSPDNLWSIELLSKLGFEFEKKVEFCGESSLYAINL